MIAVETYPAHPASVAAARRLVVACARLAQADDEATQRARLLVSELATNAVLHARSGFTVTVTARSASEAPSAPDEACLRVSVADTSPVPLSPAVPGWGSTGGRGLRLLSVLASRHGTTPAGDGKEVWFEVPRHSAVQSDDVLARCYAEQVLVARGLQLPRAG